MPGLSSCLRAGAWSPASPALPTPPGAGGAGLAAAPVAQQCLQPVLLCQKSPSSPVRQVPRLCKPSSDSCPFSSSSLSPFPTLKLSLPVFPSLQDLWGRGRASPRLHAAAPWCRGSARMDLSVRLSSGSGARAGVPRNELIPLGSRGRMTNCSD